MDFIAMAEATEHLPELLDRVSAGESITSTKDGKAVSQLVPLMREHRDS
jgi:antitoxin (DNA-binding transcriptional repressor) of toxin-antitoxin stability system